MSHNIGEEITGLYLQIERGCEFIQYNLYTPDVQGEIDVVAVNFRERVVYICEVAVHLVTGIQYVKNARPETAERLNKKFNKDIDFAEKAFRHYKRFYMLWSPIVKQSSPTAKYDQTKAVERVRQEIFEKRKIRIEWAVNERYQDCLMTLREYAGKRTEELKSLVLRIFQLEALLGRHLARRKKSTACLG